MTASRTMPGRRWWIRTAVFCLLGASIAFAVDALLLSGLRRIRNGDLGVWNALVSGRIGSDVLIVGASRALIHIDCDILARRLEASCFNIGLDGSPANIQRPYLETYLNHNAPPRLAVFSVDTETFIESREPYHLSQYHAYLNQKPIYDGLARYLDIWKYRYIPLYGFALFGHGETITAVRGLMGKDDDHSWERVLGHPSVDSEWDGSFEQFVVANPRGHRFAIDDAGVAEFERMLSMLESHGAQVVLVFSPEWEGIRPYETNRDAILQTFAAISARRGMVFLDYGDHAISRDRSLFYNSQHLNRLGASRFSVVLADDLAGLPRPGPRERSRP